MINFVGSGGHAPAFYAWDTKYLYFRYRMDRDPYDGCGGWEDYAWTVLLTVPSGDRNEFQWQLSFNGKYKTVELWKNTTRATIAYAPLFTDDAESKVWSVSYSQTGGDVGNTKPLARSLKAGTTFKGNYDYFVDFAIPVKVLVAKGAIGSSADLALTSFFPATATRANTHDRGYLYCPFQPEIECTKAADCADGNACTTETCTAGVCGNAAIPSCTPCATAGDCQDGNTCTTDVCHAGACANAPVADCTACDLDAECADGDPCTADVCGVDGSCQLTVIAGCVPCTTAADCNDDDACTTDVCGAAGTCEPSAAIDGCVPCATDADCNDNDACTTDACVAGACQAETIADCTPEACGSGQDDDADGAADCEDSDCAGDPSCQGEICGNRKDHDGDGKVDYEDDDCCTQTDSLVLRTLRMKMPSGASLNRLSITTRLAAHERATYDPLVDGASLQISEGMGQVFCHEIPMQKITRRKNVSTADFKDRTGQLAGGLRKARFRVRSNGSVRFRARGKAMSMGVPQQKDLMVTLRIGSQCMRTMAPLKSKKGHVLKFP